MQTRQAVSKAALLIVLAGAAALPAIAQEAQEPAPGQTAPNPEALPAEDRSDILPARISTGYPARALREQRQGTVALTVTVTPEGRATDCVVTQSSGHPDLDFAACKELTEKARFEPAFDDQGTPISAPFSTKITFRIK